jgi:hypothetical protein
MKKRRSETSSLMELKELTDDVGFLTALFIIVLLMVISGLLVKNGVL